MFTNIRNTISELLDGETLEADLPRTVARLSAESELKNCWSRYVVVRECLHGNATVTKDLSRRVADALEQEPVLFAPAQGNVTAQPAGQDAWRYLKPAAGLAIAASVAAIAVIGLRGDGSITRPVGPASPLSQSTLADAAPRSTVATDVQFADAEVRTPISRQGSARNDAWLNEYLLRHTEAAGFGGRAGFMPYVSIVTTDPPQSNWSKARSIPVAAPRE